MVRSSVSTPLRVARLQQCARAAVTRAAARPDEIDGRLGELGTWPCRVDVQDGQLDGQFDASLKNLPELSTRSRPATEARSTSAPLSAP